MNNLEAQISTEKLLRFLNADPEKLRVAAPHFDSTLDADQYAEEFRKTWRALRRCVDLIVEYNNETDADLISSYKRTFGISRKEKKSDDSSFLKVLKWGKAQKLARRIWYDELEIIMETATLEVIPKTTFERPWSSPWTVDFDAEGVFTPGFTLVARPRHINYVLSFVSLVSDPKIGLGRLFKCLQCGLIWIGRPGQRFCRANRGSKNCRVRWHYDQDPERKKQQVREWRKKNPGMG